MRTPPHRRQAITSYRNAAQLTTKPTNLSKIYQLPTASTKPHILLYNRPIDKALPKSTESRPRLQTAGASTMAQATPAMLQLSCDR
jgi:hypothetical protein